MAAVLVADTEGWVTAVLLDDTAQTSFQDAGGLLEGPAASKT